MNKSCGCCEGTHAITPVRETNRPGLKSIRYRAGTHASFLETMKARLSSTDFPELFGLTSRESSDPSIALLDSWATVADVLTFYQERIANEGYLRTATERRSVLELARLVGYSLKPGVAASVYLAYTLDTEYELTIPACSRSQSMPTPGELPQSFETSEPLYAKAEWNLLQPRLTKPQVLAATPVIKKVYLKGISTNLRTNDALLIVFNQREQELFRVTEVTPDATNDRTGVSLEPWLQSASAPAPIAGSVGAAIKTIRDIASRSLIGLPCVARLGAGRRIGDRLRRGGGGGNVTIGGVEPFAGGPSTDDRPDERDDKACCDGDPLQHCGQSFAAAVALANRLGSGIKRSHRQSGSIAYYSTRDNV